MHDRVVFVFSLEYVFRGDGVVDVVVVSTALRGWARVLKERADLYQEIFSNGIRRLKLGAQAV